MGYNKSKDAYDICTKGRLECRMNRETVEQQGTRRRKSQGQIKPAFTSGFPGGGGAAEHRCVQNGSSTVYMHRACWPYAST